MKKIVVEVLTTKWGKLLRIKEQTKIRSEFGKEGENIFTSSEDFSLQSCRHIQVMPGVETLYVRGDVLEYDNHIIWILSEEWLTQCRKAIREYNAYFADKPAAKQEDSDVEVIE